MARHVGFVMCVTSLITTSFLFGVYGHVLYFIPLSFAVGGITFAYVLANTSISDD